MFHLNNNYKTIFPDLSNEEAEIQKQSEINRQNSAKLQ